MCHRSILLSYAQCLCLILVLAALGCGSTRFPMLASVRRNESDKIHALTTDEPDKNTGASVFAASIRLAEPVVDPAPGILLLDPMVELASAVEPEPLPIVPTPHVPDVHGSEFPIDLYTALRLAGVENPTINLARERINEALANQLAAKVLLVPNVNVGGNYNRHNGALLDDPGQVLMVNRQNAYVGNGAYAVGSGTVTIPGIWLYCHLGDAAFEKLAARQRTSNRVFDADAVRKAIQRDVAVAYLELVGAQARLQILRKAETDVSEIVRITTAFAKVGQGVPADQNRAAASAQIVRRQIHEAEGSISAASARLCALLNLDPGVVLRTPADDVQSIQLVPENADTESLVTTAIHSRPELFARTAAIAEAETRVKQEHTRPWLPVLSVAYSRGSFGGGSSLVPDKFDKLSGRSDFQFMAVWSFQNLGFGNHARTSQADSGVGQAIANYQIMLNRVRREVAESQADARAAGSQMQVARRALEAAEQGFELETERIKLGQGRPIEALDSFQQLLDARLDLLNTTIRFDIAQFRLLVAMGTSPDETMPSHP